MNGLIFVGLICILNKYFFMSSFRLPKFKSVWSGQASVANNTPGLLNRIHVKSNQEMKRSWVWCVKKYISCTTQFSPKVWLNFRVPQGAYGECKHFNNKKCVHYAWTRFLSPNSISERGQLLLAWNVFMAAQILPTVMM